jgi:uncharacterized membrane protein (UPF0127 family)
VPVAGFGELAFRLVQAGVPAEQAEIWCALLAETEAQHQQGLKGRTDLSGYDGMVFRFATDVSGAFYMRTVPVPLSIAWFSASGALVGTADMAPCGDRDDCPLYGPNRSYRYAIEVLEGGLPRLGVGPDARLELLGACPA